MSDATSFGRLTNQLDDKGTKNFPDFMTHLGEVGTPKLAQLITNMTDNEVREFARMLNTMPADQMKNIAGVFKNVDPAAYLFHLRNPKAAAKTGCVVLLGLLLAAGAVVAGVVLVIG